MHRGRRIFAGWAYGPNYYPYSDYYDSEEGIVEAPAEPMIAPRGASAPAPAAEATRPAESLVMELRGDRWVRLTSYGPMEIAGQYDESQAGRASGLASATASTATSSQTPIVKELPPAVLVFRDGHQEEATKYTIVGKTIYVKSDYWSSGSWTRKIAIADLDLAATLKTNQKRGARFSLPSRPSEVIFRP
jgi:hypothetical protein